MKILKILRKTGISQEELANKLHVVRKTYQSGKNVYHMPDSSLLISLADELDSSTTKLLKETIEEKDESNLDTNPKN